METKHTPTGNVHTGDIEYSHPESTEETDLEELSSEPVFLPAVASLPADRGDDSYLLTSHALGNTTSSIDGIYDEAEQSMARVALSLESIFDGLGLSDTDRNTEPKTSPI